MQLGNNRGNKYSKKSTRFSPASNDFWDFSIDQFAFHDIPDSIDYILATTSQKSLSYIGFSQGTAQAFATLSIHPTLNDKVDVFIALAPAMSPAGLRNGVVDSLMKASPEVLFLAFGRRSMLSSATMWQSILYPPIFVRVIDMALSFLFNWSGNNITFSQKLAAYPHLYSFTSTKSVVHWFQIIRNRSFQMYDDDVQAPLSLGASDRYYKVAKFPTRNIKTPIVLVYGGSDSLVDIDVMLKELPRHTIAKEVPHFEHLDFLWGTEVESLVFPHVFEALTAYAGRDHVQYPSELLISGALGRGFGKPLKEEISPLGHGIHPRELTYEGVNGRLPITGSNCSEDDQSSLASDLSPETNRAAVDNNPAGIVASGIRFPLSTPRNRRHISPPSSSGTSASLDGTTDVAVTPKQKHRRSLLGSHVKHTRRESGSSSSVKSLDSSEKRFGTGGISVGASKATIGVSNSSIAPRKSEKSSNPPARKPG